MRCDKRAPAKSSRKDAYRHRGKEEGRRRGRPGLSSRTLRANEGADVKAEPLVADALAYRLEP